MHSLITQLILSEQMIAYALADAAGCVQSVYGDPQILWGRDNPMNVIGQSLLALLPELVGSEEATHALLAGEIEHLRFELLNREDSQGNTRYVTLVLRGYRDPDTAARGLLLLAQDVTEYGMAQQELLQRHNELHLLQQRLERQNLELAASNTELRLMNEIRSSFISVAAHELRTPLTAIYGFLELLQDTGAENLTAQQNEHLGWIEASTQRLLVTLNELLDAARIDSDRLELVLRPTPIHAIVDDAMLEFEPRLAAHGQQLEVEMATDLPAALCDPARIEQVVGHLLSNASKFTPDGGTLTLAVHPTASGEFLRLSVSDQGHGIEQQAEAHLFERFYRGAQVRKNGTTGAGLGLYITRSLVELHGGEIWYESRPGQGSTFHVTVPVVTPAPGLGLGHCAGQTL
ncbi:MAG: PAS domain-containing sensor histidine kinase [Chloroflexi bacterium]|nr:MAG: PAS domain-containing sensor histidine kinase [Chloroflexota bacterium]